MSKPKYIYLWDNVDKTIQTIESRIDLVNRRTDLYDPNFFPKTIMVVQSNLLIFLEKLCQWNNHMILCMGLSLNGHPLVNNFLCWKVVVIQGGRISWRHFHHLAMNSYLHKKNITLKNYHIMYPMKQKDLCDHDTKMYYVQWFNVWWNHHEYNLKN